MLPNEAIEKAYEDYLKVEEVEEVEEVERQSIYCTCGEDISNDFEEYSNEEILKAIDDSDEIKSCGGQWCMP